MFVAALCLALLSICGSAQTGEDCWGACGHRGGHCGWCDAKKAGVTQACCRFGWNDPAECKRALYSGAPYYHQCVELVSSELPSGPLSRNNRWYVADNMGWRNMKPVGSLNGNLNQCKKRCEDISACNAINVGKGGTANLCEMFQYALEHAKYTRHSLPDRLHNDGGWAAYFVRKGVPQVDGDYQMNWLCRDMVGLENCPGWVGLSYQREVAGLKEVEKYNPGYRMITVVGASALILAGVYGCVKKMVRGKYPAEDSEAGLI